MKDTNKIPFPELIEDLQKYANNTKALRVYHKAVKLKKIDLAIKIAKKYNLQVTGNSDTVTALMMAKYAMSVKK